MGHPVVLRIFSFIVGKMICLYKIIALFAAILKSIRPQNVLGEVGVRLTMQLELSTG